MKTVAMIVMGLCLVGSGSVLILMGVDTILSPWRIKGTSSFGASVHPSGGAVVREITLPSKNYKIETRIEGGGGPDK